MQINVVNIIIDSLLANGKCSIEGLGTFILNKDLPKVDTKNNKIEAPLSSVTFEDTVHSEHRLKDELLKVYPFSEEKSNKVVNLFANKVVNGLINFDHIELKNLGVLQNNEKKSGLSFTLSPTLGKVIAASQPDVNLKPFIEAKKEAEEKAKKEAETAQKLKQKKEKEEAERRVKEEADRKAKEEAKRKENAKAIVPPVVESKPVTPVPTAKETVVPVTSQVVDSPLSSNSKSNSSEIKPVAPIKEREVFIHQDDESFFSKYLPWIMLMLLLAGLAWGVKKLYHSISTDGDNTEVVIEENDTSGSDSDQDSSDGELTEQADQNNASGNDDSKEVVTEKPIQPSECIIITGSYLDQQNMDEMSSKIRMMGYEVYTEKYGYYTRVGFKFPCQDVNLKLFIEEIRASISKESWYLVPDLSI